VARERIIYFLELVRENATSITSHHVLEGNAGYSQAVKRRTSKCKHCTAVLDVQFTGHDKNLNSSLANAPLGKDKGNLAPWFVQI